MHIPRSVSGCLYTDSCVLRSSISSRAFFPSVEWEETVGSTGEGVSIKPILSFPEL